MKLAAVQTGEHLESKWSRTEIVHVVAQTQKDMQEKLQVQVQLMSQQIPHDGIQSGFYVCKRKIRFNELIFILSVRCLYNLQ